MESIMIKATDELRHFPKTVEALLISHSANHNPDNPVQWRSADDTKSQVVKPDRKLRDGDFTVSAALVQLALPDEEQVSSFIKCLETEGQKWALPISKSSLTSNGLLSIKLHRPTLFQKVITEVVDEGEKYGHGQSQDVGVEVLLNNATSLSLIEESLNVSEGCKDVSLSQLRAALFCEHLKNILKVLGFSIQEINHTMSPELQSVFKTFEISPCSVASRKERKSLLRCKLVDKAAASKYRVPESKLSSDGRYAGDMQKDGQPLRNLSSNCVILDLRQYASDCSLALGKGSFDKNIHLAKVTSEDGSQMPILHHCADLEEACQESDLKTVRKVIHIATKKKEFQQQQVDLAWRIISDVHLTKSSQLHVVCGPVLTRRSGGSDREMNVEEFYKIREAQTREASVMKYGDVKGDHWEEVIRHLTIAGIKFELLGIQLNNQVKLDTSDTRENTSWPDSRDGVFVMYNCARLSTLFTNYEREVNNGVYPSLPNLSSIDFSTLREDQEWGLIFNYVLLYPSLLQDIHHEVMTNSALKVNLQTHKICGFLVSLSRDLSSYYSHVHILGGGHSHLLPVMFARLYLMKAVQQVLKNGLALLNIRPLEQM